MKLARLPYSPDVMADFFADSLGALGAVCERTWHDRLAVLAEGRAARLWPEAGALHEAELSFVAAGAGGARDARREVFPGCPLTFGLAEALRPAPLRLERLVLAADAREARLPDVAVLEKRWRSQFPDTGRWILAKPPVAGWHFSMVAWMRLETQAIDQHWSLHRVAMSWPDGGRDEGQAEGLTHAIAVTGPEADRVKWPAVASSQWAPMLGKVIEEEGASALGESKERQQARLRRELERVDAYFASYEAELRARVARTRSTEGAAKLESRLAAAQAEHARHRADQMARHEVVVRPQFDALVWVAEPAWLATVGMMGARVGREVAARFVSRARRWVVTG
ncbi:MAG: hypothetical protein EAZ36_01070 [Verrucomicrobia bacterium]|nr:MAG: hypothetical protein EAZ36_01070 [Verrucomicrobiota bacterium]